MVLQASCSSQPALVEHQHFHCVVAVFVSSSCDSHPIVRSTSQVLYIGLVLEHI